ncbi:MAG TPA: hypothetical protein VG820_01685 [Fimbriimonadaceae bacterium]|nr:hypothetical protein [Fimbriimonadaceae bacterium]
MLLALLAVLILVIIGLNAARRRKAQDRFLSTNEYWVYLPGDRMPDQNAVMTHVIGENRYKQGGRNPISPREGLLLSDIRLHMALVLRNKNPHVFRPDLFDDHVEPTADILSALADSQSLVKVRYVSEQPLKDRASIQLLPHLADAMAELGKGRVVYDCTMEVLISKEDLERTLAENLSLDLTDLQVRVVWRRADRGGWAETRGLRKIGLPELATEQMEADEQVLVTDVLAEAAKKLWEAGQLLPQVDVRLYEDDFRVIVSPPRNRIAAVKILRVQSV